MSTTTLAPAPRTAPALKEVLLGILLPYLGVSRQELEARGPGMPVDSLDLFDVLPEFWKATGLKVPTRNLRRQTMRSIDAFVSFVASEASE